MKSLALIGLLVIPSMTFAAEPLDAAALKTLLTGNTAEVLSAGGNTWQIYFSPDGKLIRKDGNNIVEGRWRVEDDGKHCVEGTPGGCGKFVKNDDGTYDRTAQNGYKVRWLSVTPGKGF